VLKLRYAALAAGAFLLVAGCGGGDAPEVAETTDTPVDEVVETPVDEVVETPVEEVALYPEGTLDPATVTADTPVYAWMLYDAYFAWDGMPVTLVAYPYIPYMRDTMTVVDELRLIADPEDSDELATAVFAASPDRIVNAGEMIAIQGTVEMTWTGDIEVVDAVFIDPPETMEYVETSPWAYDGVTPLPVDEFYELYNVWTDREVTVEGYYHSTTTSTTDYGTTIRVDLAHPDDIYTKYVACEMVEEIPADSDTNMVENREGVQIRGIITGESFDMVGLEGCVLLNR
jgi:hypothetical protein